MYVDQSTWVQTLLFPFMPVICTAFIVSPVVLGDLPFNDDDDDDDGGGGLMQPVYNYLPQGT